MLKKNEKMIRAITALFMLIFVIGALIFVFQSIIISNRKKELSALRAEKARLEQMIAEGSDEIAILEQRETVEELARRLGFKYPEDVEKV